MDRILISIGPFSISWYAFFITLGVLIASALIIKEAKKFNIQKDFVINLIFWCIIIGFLGARLYYVIFNWDYYSVNLSEIYKVWNGGLAIHGGIIFGGLFMLLYCKKYKAPIGRIFDIVVPYVLLAQALGRWGNFFNSEAYGPVVSYETLKSLYIPNFVISGMYIEGSYRLPMFYFEFLWNILGVIALIIIRKRKYVKVGIQTGSYLMIYSFGRYFIEIFRTDSLMLKDIKVAQLVSVILFIIGFIVAVVQVRKPKLDNLYNGQINEEIKHF